MPGGGKQGTWVENTSRPSVCPAGQLRSISQFDICDLRLRQVLVDLMEKVAACLDVQEVELVELEEEVKKLVAEEDLLVLDPPEDLIKARVENEKLK